MTDQVEIRRVTAAEHAAVGDLMVRVNRAAHGDLARRYEVYVADIAARDAEAEVLVALVDGTVAGAVVFIADHASPMADRLAPGEAGVRMLAVEPALQRRGIGSALTRACIERSRELRKARVILHADATAPGVWKLYEGLGFTRDPGRDRVAGDGTRLAGFVFTL